MPVRYYLLIINFSLTSQIPEKVLDDAVGHILGRKTKLFIAFIHYTNVALVGAFFFVLQFVGLWNLLALSLWPVKYWQLVKNIIYMIVGSK
jgi:hypothetical protein